MFLLVKRLVLLVIIYFTAVHANAAIPEYIPGKLLTDSSIVKKQAGITPPDPVISTDSPSCIIPFTRAGNLILVRAKADTVEGNFILDTGAPGLVLNMTISVNTLQQIVLRESREEGLQVPLP